MTPAFGFSVGDFISAISGWTIPSFFEPTMLILNFPDLIKKICRSLRQVGGASADYQHAIIELRGLENILQQLEALEPTEDNINYVNAIRGMALACQLPLRNFMTKLDKYESALGPFAERTSFRGVGRKAKWAVSFAGEVEKLRALVVAKHISINLLLATHTSYGVTRVCLLQR